MDERKCVQLHYLQDLKKSSALFTSQIGSRCGKIFLLCKSWTFTLSKNNWKGQKIPRRKFASSMTSIAFYMQCSARSDWLYVWATEAWWEVTHLRTLYGPNSTSLQLVSPILFVEPCAENPIRNTYNPLPYYCWQGAKRTSQWSHQHLEAIWKPWAYCSMTKSIHLKSPPPYFCIPGWRGFLEPLPAGIGRKAEVHPGLAATSSQGSLRDTQPFALTDTHLQYSQFKACTVLGRI